MSWQAAKADAERFASFILQRMKEAGAAGAPVRLAEFPDLETYQFLKPGEEWPWRHHQAVIRAAARQLRRAGHPVTLVPVTLPAYLDYLARGDLKNTTENRAAFIGQATEG